MTPSSMIMDDTSWDDPVVPINITIDSSIDVFGNNNTVILPSASSPKGITPSSTDSDDSMSSATATSAQRGRAAKIGHPAAVIIAALKQAGGLTDDLGRTRPIQIGINSGIKIDGKNNTVCTGERQPRRIFAYSSPVVIGEKRCAESEPPAPGPPAKHRR
ncbi:uncharacterized protein N7498_010134 [Penicillium cinerascens]|uniref:Uncharacterized protein n=1 Tax=Penicillium cinerascens TaxID=70096 RepID=A0A9W9J7D9_9EURO|nr:uncharacterized protein N7498_010134 [Penicillium cinerascens]KAJ5191149.1 hypothetical protein N7498_010134 [Penicillium cinerascens]